MTLSKKEVIYGNENLKLLDEAGYSNTNLTLQGNLKKYRHLELPCFHLIKTRVIIWLFN